jgi:hypothetical protein
MVTYFTVSFNDVVLYEGNVYGRKKDCHTKDSNKNSSPEDMKSLQIQLQNLQEQNMKLAEEVRLLKSQENQKGISLTKIN